MIFAILCSSSPFHFRVCHRCLFTLVDVGRMGGRTMHQVVETLPEENTLRDKVAALRATYASLSELYQESKDGAANDKRIPLN